MIIVKTSIFYQIFGVLADVPKVYFLYFLEFLASLECKFDVFSHLFGYFYAWVSFSLHNVQQVFHRHLLDKVIAGHYFYLFFLEEFLVNLVLQIFLYFFHIWDCHRGVDFFFWGVFHVFIFLLDVLLSL